MSATNAIAAVLPTSTPTRLCGRIVHVRAWRCFAILLDLTMVVAIGARCVLCSARNETGCCSEAHFDHFGAEFNGGREYPSDGRHRLEYSTKR